MDPIFYTLLGMGIGYIGSQVLTNKIFQNKQNKNPQQNQPTKKFLPSTPDIKKAFQQNQIPQQIQRRIEFNDQLRKIVKIQPPLEQQDTDSQFSQPQDSENSKPNQFNNSDHNTQPQTPNFQNIAQAKSNIQLFVTPEQIQQMNTSPLILQQNKFSVSQKHRPQSTSSVSHSESSPQSSDKEE
ncbi:unnamed protein product (macronuclear) [Paramecium tetraurelia]|uniref:Transmembrane protein n=1 Tax=Paramecium tetraurelia TaxID=5888 RepID=A0D8X3_PARTE|nr:uncharacterized protein GSPATT00014436001 [Paramecium tetraurelia]CAK79490.1 unnamed protein product [Paramecium tetraurelia]|eukprot:XP_001446887.1 hypothetical protein (macronuclear) [Paramecium tetraurelia strain d4-2]